MIKLDEFYVSRLLYHCKLTLENGIDIFDYFEILTMNEELIKFERTRPLNEEEDEFYNLIEISIKNGWKFSYENGRLFIGGLPLKCKVIKYSTIEKFEEYVDKDENVSLNEYVVNFFKKIFTNKNKGETKND